MDTFPYTDILWDFNGTLLDDVDAGIEANNRMLVRRSLPKIDRESYQRLVPGKIRDFYLRMGFDLEKEDFVDIAAEWTAEYLDCASDAGLRQGALECLEHFAALGVTQSILSASRDSILEEQIDRLGIGRFFSVALGLDNSHTVDKREAAAEWRSKHPHAKALIIGDSEHDAEVARSISCDCLLVEGGHRNRETLSGCGFPVLGSLYELL